MKKALWITTAVLVGIFSVMCFVITSPQRSLRRFLKEVAKAEVGKTTLADWRAQVAQAHLSNVTSNCDQQKQRCGVDWIGTNRILHKLHLAPLIWVDASIEFQDGIASDINVWVVINDSPDINGVMGPGTGVTVSQTANRQSCNLHYGSYRNQRGSQKVGVVHMDSCVSSEDHAKAFAIHTSCFSKIGGCKTPDDILPRVFARGAVEEE